MEKQVYTLNKSELLALTTAENRRIAYESKYKEIKKLAFIVRAIELMPENLTVKVEGVRGNTEERTMFNCGSFIECLVKHYRNGYDETWKTFNDEKADLKNGFMDWEIKASLPNARNTAINEPKNLILINTVGVFIIKKSVSMELPMDSNGRYYENEDYSENEGVKHYKKMESALGIR